MDIIAMLEKYSLTLRRLPDHETNTYFFRKIQLRWSWIIVTCMLLDPYLKKNSMI